MRVRFWLRRGGVVYVIMHDMEQKIATNSYEFESIRKYNGIYVDKTAYLYPLVSSEPFSAQFFVSRPRRFGKSTMISTLECIFKGQKELFEGLDIVKTDYDWKAYPVMRFDMSGVSVGSEAAFLQRFSEIVDVALHTSGWTYRKELSPGANFEQALLKLYEGEDGQQQQPVVVLIDEYDYPIAHALGNPAMAQFVHEQMSDFYLVLKRQVKKLRFLMITGISKFSKLSLFSGLNNITDLTMEKPYATMFGYTEEELAKYFSKQMHARAESMGLSDEAFHAELKRWYNGYRFFNRAPTVYNPFAIAKALTGSAEQFGSTWSQDCRPTLLVNYLQQLRGLNIDLNGEIYVRASEIGSVSTLDSLKPMGILYQTGYLTIDHFDKRRNWYVLRVPDEELRLDLNEILRDLYDGNQQTNFYDLFTAFTDDELNTFMAILKPMYSNLVYGIKESSIHEDNYRRVLHTFFITNGVTCEVEKHQSNGSRADLVVEYEECVYIFEFKNRDGDDAQVALEQIEDRKYMAPYLVPGRKIRQIGLAFNPKTHELIDWAWRTAGADAGRRGAMPESERVKPKAKRKPAKRRSRK